MKLNWKAVGIMNDKETITTLMTQLSDVRRIQNAADRDAEIEYQVKMLKAKLEACGVNTEQL